MKKKVTSSKKLYSLIFTAQVASVFKFENAV